MESNRTVMPNGLYFLFVGKAFNELQVFLGKALAFSNTPYSILNPCITITP